MSSGKRPLTVSPNEKNLQNRTKKFQNMPNNTADVFSWNAMRNMLDDTLDIKLKDMVKKDDLNAIIQELEAVKAENMELKREMKKLASKLEFIDKKTRSSNIVVNGLQNTNALAAKTEFAKLCDEVLEVNLNINSTSVIGKNTVMFNLDSSAAVQKVLGAKRKLKGLTIFIQKDFTAQEQTTRYHLRQIVKKLKYKNNSLNIKLGEFCFFINNKKFQCKNDSVIAFSKEDFNFLKDLFQKSECKYEIIVNEQKNNMNQ